MELRRKLSLLLSHGHLDAGSYPLGFLKDEARLVVERENHRMATEGTIIQGAGLSLFGKEGGEHFRKLLEALRAGD